MSFSCVNIWRSKLSGRRGAAERKLRIKHLPQLCEGKNCSLVRYYLYMTHSPWKCTFLTYISQLIWWSLEQESYHTQYLGYYLNQTPQMSMFHAAGALTNAYTVEPFRKNRFISCDTQTGQKKLPGSVTAAEEQKTDLKSHLCLPSQTWFVHGFVLVPLEVQILLLGKKIQVFGRKKIINNEIVMN